MGAHEKGGGKARRGEERETKPAERSSPPPRADLTQIVRCGMCAAEMGYIPDTATILTSRTAPTRGLPVVELDVRCPACHVPAKVRYTEAPGGMVTR